MEKENQGILQMIPPLRGGDFQGITGLSSDDSLLVGVSTARKRSFNKAPALSNIGSMSPARLSLSTVASPHCRLLFHLAGRILAEKQPRLSRQPRTKRLSSLTGGWKSSNCSPLPVEGEIFFLTFPFIEQAISSQPPLCSLSAHAAVSECNGDFLPIMRLPDLNLAPERSSHSKNMADGIVWVYGCANWK